MEEDSEVHKKRRVETHSDSGIKNQTLVRLEAKDKLADRDAQQALDWALVACVQVLALTLTLL